jgi:Zn-dependent protease with chaperone function
MSPLAPEFDLWWQTFVVLGVGGGAVMLLAALAARWLRTASWQQAVYRAAIVALLGLWLVETSGVANLSANIARGLGDVASSVAPRIAPRRAQLASEPRVFSFDGASTELPADAMVMAADAAPSEVPAAARQHGGRSWWPAWIWLIGGLVVAGRFLSAAVDLFRVRRRFSPVDDPQLVATADQLAETMGMRRRVRLLECEGLGSPVAFGLFRPTVVLPGGFAQQFPAIQQAAILAHEVAHLASRDPLWQCLSQWACVLLWWHPAAWWTRRALREANEAVADEASLLLPDGPCLLADGLVSLGRWWAGRERMGWLSLEGDAFQSGLGKRVERLLTLSPQPWQRLSRRMALAALVVLPAVCVCVVLACTAWARVDAHAISEGSVDANVRPASEPGSLAAALYAALGTSPAPATANEEPAFKLNPVQTALALATPDEVRKDADRKEADREAVPPAEKPAIREDDPKEMAPPSRMKDVSRDAIAPIRELHDHRRDLEHRNRILRQRLQALSADQQVEAKEITETIEKYQQELNDLNWRIANAPLPPDDLRSQGPLPRDGLRVQGLPPRDGFRPQGLAPRDGFRPEGPRPREAFRDDGLPLPPDAIRPVGPPPEEEQGKGPPAREREVSALRQEVEQMRHEMRELREMLQRALEQRPPK